MELERKAQQQSLQQTEENAALKEKKEKIDPSIFAVTDVFFRCPYLSDEILLRDEWKKKIREFLYEQLMGEEAGLTACLIIQSCNSGKEKIESCVETLGKYLDNIINNPDVEKYWKIRMCNRIFQVILHFNNLFKIILINFKIYIYNDLYYSYRKKFCLLKEH